MRNSKKLGLLAAGITLAGVSCATVYYQAPAAFAQENTITLETNAPQEDDDTDLGYLPNVKAITQKVMPSIVAITAASKETISVWGRQYEYDSESAGSGVIIAKDDDELMIATNNHVVEDADDLTVLFSVDTENEDDALVSALVKGTDSSLDLAVVAVKIADIPQDVLDQIQVVEIGDSSQVSVGDWSIAIGNALGYGQSVTFGIVSALDREVTLSTDNGEIKNNMIQTDAAINFGNSGGALLNASGQLIGINSAKASSTGVEGMGYAIPIDTAMPILEELMNQTTRIKVDEAKKGVMGINITDVSEEARQLYNIPSGAYVISVNGDSAAEKAGMEKGDIITKLEKTNINSVNELLARMEYYEAGEEVEVTIQHPSGNGYEEKVLTVTLQKKDASDTPEEIDASDLEAEEETESNNFGFFQDAPEEGGRGDFRNDNDLTGFGFRF